MGFAETYITLLSVGILLGLVFLFASRVLVGALIPELRLRALLGLLIFGAALFVAFTALPVRPLMQGHLLDLIIIAAVFSGVLLLTASPSAKRRRTRFGALGIGTIVLATLLFVVTAYAFVTGDFSRLRGEELVALVEVKPSELANPLSRTYPVAEFIPGAPSTEDPIAVSFPARTPSIDMEIYTLDQGKLGEQNSCRLPGNLWGVGGQVIEVDNWLLLFGPRSFYRLTTIDAKFADNRLPHVGENLPGYDPFQTRRRLDEVIPVIDRQLKELCSVRQTITDYDFMTYTPITQGRHYGIYAKRQGGFIPRLLREEEFDRLLNGVVR